MFFGCAAAVDAAAWTFNYHDVIRRKVSLADSQRKARRRGVKHTTDESRNKKDSITAFKGGSLVC